jgi:hypothetical protein
MFVLCYYSSRHIGFGSNCPINHGRCSVKRSVLFLIVLGLLSPLFFGCSGDDGAVGPSGPAG